VLAYRAGQPITARQFLAYVEQLLPLLGSGRHVLNACSDRYHFMAGLAACLVGDKISLLPSTYTPEVLRQMREFAPDVVCLSDDPANPPPLPCVFIPAAAASAGSSGLQVPQIEREQLAAYVFTSGSTGTPLAHRKTWGRLVDCVQEEARQLELAAGPAAALVATVPPQHMYGFESSVLLPLVGGQRLCAERPFYPADIVAALASVPRPRVLVTTPVHLRALLGAGITLPPIELLVCSTAPLAQQLAAEAEQRFETRLLEIYGSTETGQIAVRRPTVGAEWSLWPGIALRPEDDETWAEGGHIEQPTRMCDVLELTGPGRFLLHGRLADLVNIAGKRSSLAYLNHQLNSIPGVLDGAFFHVDDLRSSHTGVTRLAACVVAPQLDATQLLAALRERLDPVFLPRPLLFVARLPRNSTGKLPQEALRALAAGQSKSARTG
jgi:acyl-coenzyme A synthetase/AMP-(fatty) acid ligase